MAKQHAPRYIIEVRSGNSGKWFRSANEGLDKAFFSLEEAQKGLEVPDAKSEGLTYRIRRK